jgi:hypothetical protein
MLPEIEKYFQTDIEISLKIFKLQGKKSDFQGKDIFKIPEFWLTKGCLI